MSEAKLDRARKKPASIRLSLAAGSDSYFQLRAQL
jgi:hypothetical protein